MTQQSELEETFALQLRAYSLKAEREYKFSKSRKWRFDFAFIDEKIAVEIEGGVWTQGRHTRPLGFIQDCDKYNSAGELGWRVFRYTESHIKSGKAIDQIRKVFALDNS